MNGNTAAEGASLSRRGFLRLGAAGAAVTAADGGKSIFPVSVG